MGNGEAAMSMLLVDPAELKPRRMWYALAVVFPVAGAVLGAAAFWLTITKLPEVDHEFANGDSVTVALTTDDRATLYVDDAVYDDDQRVNDFPQCQATGPGEVDLDQYDASVTLGTGDVTWRAIYDLTVTERGEYTITCSLADAAGAGDVFAVGTKFNIPWLVAGIVGVFVLPLAGLFVGTVIALVVWARRSKQANRLRFERADQRLQALATRK